MLEVVDFTLYESCQTAILGGWASERKCFEICLSSSEFSLQIVRYTIFNLILFEDFYADWWAPLRDFGYN